MPPLSLHLQTAPSRKRLPPGSGKAATGWELVRRWSLPWLEVTGWPLSSHVTLGKRLKSLLSSVFSSVKRLIIPNLVFNIRIKWPKTQKVHGTELGPKTFSLDVSPVTHIESHGEWLNIGEIQLLT